MSQRSACLPLFVKGSGFTGNRKQQVCISVGVSLWFDDVLKLLIDFSDKASMDILTSFQHEVCVKTRMRSFEQHKTPIFGHPVTWHSDG